MLEVLEELETTAALMVKWKKDRDVGLDRECVLRCLFLSRRTAPIASEMWYFLSFNVLTFYQVTSAS
jgi:hypothetical protein